MLKLAFFHTFSSLIQLNNMLQGSFLFHSKNAAACIASRSRLRWLTHTAA